MDIHLNEQIHYQLCQVNELHNGQMKEFEIKTAQINSSVLLIRQNNKFYAYTSKCCHYKLPLIKGLNRNFFLIL
jgi:nitrite reductase/ring-hydroxylating ferredoxin subunit